VLRSSAWRRIQTFAPPAVPYGGSTSGLIMGRRQALSPIMFLRRVTMKTATGVSRGCFICTERDDARVEAPVCAFCHSTSNTSPEMKTADAGCIRRCNYLHIRRLRWRVRPIHPSRKGWPVCIPAGEQIVPSTNAEVCDGVGPRNIHWVPIVPGKCLAVCNIRWHCGGTLDRGGQRNSKLW
jgi:hypothetical protein